MDVATDSEALGLQGRLDGSSVREVRARLYHLIDSTAGDVVVDLSMVDVIDAAGLGVLAGAHRRMERANRHLILRGCGARVRRVLARTRLMRVMHIEPVRAVT